MDATRACARRHVGAPEKPGIADNSDERRRQMERDPVVEEARERLGAVASKMCRRIDPLDVAGSFLAIGMIVLVTDIGRDGAAEYMARLTKELQGDDPVEWPVGRA
jgi:hypothetical protein